MAVVVGELPPGTLGDDNLILERLLFEKITQSEGLEIVETALRLHERAERSRAGDASAGAFVGSRASAPRPPSGRRHCQGAT